jgi:hypothetical protein
VCRRRFVVEELESRFAPAVLPRPDHVVIVIEENHDYAQIIGSPSAPYLNSLAQQGALMTASAGVEHPSQPNYLDLFSGSNQGVTSNARPAGLPFTTPNLGAQLRNAGLSFVGYAESLPAAGFDGDVYSSIPGQNQYERKHNPWVNWVNNPVGINQLPPSVNQPFASFPTDFSLLPTVAIVVPNEQNNMHDGSVQQGDAWLGSNLGGYVQWAKNHNSLLIVTFDENDGSPGNHIPTIFVGPMVKPGFAESQPVNHFNVLRTIEDLFGLPSAGASAGAAPITTIWDLTAPTVVSVTPNSNIPGLAGAQRSRIASLVVAFDRPVQIETNAIALAVHASNVFFAGAFQPFGMGAIPTLVLSNSPDRKTWTVTFTGANTELGADGLASLKDGVYDLNIDATKVHPVSVPGINMTSANTTTTFHRLFGDTDAPSTPPGGTPGVDFTAVVNTGDNFVFRGAFNRLGPDYKAYLDFDGDGIINTGDNVEFRNRFNRTLRWRV